MRRVYLENKEYQGARSEFVAQLEQLGALEPLAGKLMPIRDSLGMVTAEAVVSKSSVPHYHASAMDGIAVRAEDTYQARETNPVVLTLDEDAVEVDTGDPLPSQFNAVIMVEEVQFIDNGKVEIIAAASPWQHVRAIGEDMIKGEVIIPSNHTLTAPDLGAVIAGGIKDIEVRRQPKVAVIPTGSELVPPGKLRHGVRLWSSIVLCWAAYLPSGVL